ncbi:MAG: hypothetical protein EXS05_24630 [Planctomycetaceae bacterium]|nr:hypothetical protein [Planctomycetaceae bacterium]
MRSFLYRRPARLRSISRFAAIPLAAAIAWAGGSPLAAQEDQGDPNVPLVVINVASVERLLNQAITTFETAGRPELSETLSGALERVNDLKGIDRGQSMGVMVFLNGFSPEGVAYVPVKNLDDLLKTIEIGPVTTNKTGDDRFEITVPGRTLYGRVVEDYAFIADNAAAIDREFRDPVRLTGRLSQAYDLSVSFNLKGIAPATRDLFVNVLRANNENNLQRRDNEPEGQYRIRRAAGQSNVEAIETLVSQGEELTIGWTVSAESKSATLEFVLKARPGSDYAAYFNEAKGHRSRFANLLVAQNPLTASLTWRLDKSARKMVLEMIGAAEAQMLKNLGLAAAEPATGSEAPSGNAVQQVARVLRSTVNAGTIDAAVQFVGQPSGPFVLVGGLKIADAESLSGAVSEILDGVKKNSAVEEVRLNVLTHKGVALHRIEFKTVGPGIERLYGGKPGLFVGVGDDALWLAFGNEEASTAELKRAIDKSAEPIAETATDSPFQLVMNFARWMDMFDPENRPDGFASLARGAFAKGGDALRIEARPIDDGIRTRITMDEAFIRLVGQQIARQIDQNAE